MRRAALIASVVVGLAAVPALADITQPSESATADGSLWIQRADPRAPGDLSVEDMPERFPALAAVSPVRLDRGAPERAFAAPVRSRIGHARNRGNPVAVQQVSEPGTALLLGAGLLALGAFARRRS